MQKSWKLQEQATANANSFPAKAQLLGSLVLASYLLELISKLWGEWGYLGPGWLGEKGHRGHCLPQEQSIQLELGFQTQFTITIVSLLKQVPHTRRAIKVSTITITVVMEVIHHQNGWIFGISPNPSPPVFPFLGTHQHFGTALLSNISKFCNNFLDRNWYLGTPFHGLDKNREWLQLLPHIRWVYAAQNCFCRKSNLRGKFSYKIRKVLLLRKANISQHRISIISFS